MTDRELMQMALDALEDVDGIDTETECVTIDVGEVIEALRARLAQPEQEPVAWMEIEKYIDEDNLWDSRKILRDYDNGLGEPLYTAPPKREWQGLTEAERIDIIDEEITAQSTEHFALAQAIEAKLKEKNNAS